MYRPTFFGETHKPQAVFEDHALDSASDYGLFDSDASVSKQLWEDVWLWASASQLSEILGATVTAQRVSREWGRGYMGDYNECFVFQSDF